MDFTVMQIIQGVLLFFILVGLLFGIWKGFGKSVIRLFTVLAMAVVCFFCSPPIAKALATTNISGLGINIAGVQVVTVGDAVVAFLQKIGIINEFMIASPTFKSFVETIPVLVLNVVVFSLFFLILLAFSHIISWLIAKFTLKKHKKGEHKRFRLLGGLVGAVQAVLVFAVLAVPLFGLADTAEAALKAAETSSSSSAEGTTASCVVGSEEYSIIAATNTNDTEKQIDEIKNTVSPIIEQYNNTFFVKAFRAVGLASIDTKVFGKLTETTINHEQVRLKSEVVTLAKVSGKLNSIINLSENSTDKDFENAKEAVSTLFESKLVSRIAEETVNYVAINWLDESNPTAFDVQKPNLGSLGNGLMDAALGELKTATRTTLKNDIVQAISVMQIAAKNDILKSLKDGGNSEDLLDSLSKEGVVSSVIETMTKSDTLRAIIPSAMQTAMNSIYETLDIGSENQVKIDNVELTTQEWEQEKTILENIFVNFINAYDSTKEEKWEKDGEGHNKKGDTVFDNFDFTALGKVFDSMRHSILLDGREGEKEEVDDRVSFQIVDTLLRSGLMEGISVDDDFINIIKDGWTDPTFEFQTAFDTLHGAVSIMNSFNNGEDLSAENVSTLIDGLASDSGEKIVDMITSNILTNEENTESQALEQAVQDIASSISDRAKQAKENGEDYDADAEAKALNTALDILNQTNDDSSSDPISITPDQIDDILASDIIYNSIIDATTGSELGTNVQSAAEGNDDLADNIIIRYNNAETEAEQQKINDFYKMLFGTDIPQA